MSVRTTATEGTVALYDSVTGLAFGPVFETEDEAEAFLEHLTDIGERDPRLIPAVTLAALAAEFRGELDEPEEPEAEPEAYVVAVREDGSYRYEVDDDRRYDLAKERGEL